jgi:outer membrane biosynthesis protein TonB
VGKRAGDQAGGFVEEGASLGAKIGVGVAQGGDPNAVAAGEIAQSASKLGVGPVGKAGLGHAIDGVADRIPIKGSPRPTPAQPNAPTAQPPAPVVPTRPPVPTRPVPPPPVSRPPVPTRPVPPVPVDPANLPLPPSPTTTGRPAVPPVNTSDAQSNGGTGSASPSSDGFVTAPTSPTSSDGFVTAPTSPTDGPDAGDGN